MIIELGEYAKYRKEGESLLDFWFRGIAANRKKKETQTELDNKNIIVIFDGLNEIDNRQLYAETVRQIVDFASYHKETKIVITLRELSYDDKPFEHAGFSHFKLESFDNLQQEEFIGKWLAAIKGERSKKFGKTSPQQGTDRQEEEKIEKARLSREIKRFPSIADKPGLLMMMAIILNVQDSLPSEEELYAHLSRMLLASSNDNGIDRQEKYVLLGMIAHEMQFRLHNLDGNSIDYESLKHLLMDYLAYQKFIDPRAIAVKTIKQLKSDRFITCVNDISESEDNYSFVNPKFLAYFCAREIKRKFGTSPSVIANIFSDHWGDKNRHESLKSICGVLDVKIALELVQNLMNLQVDRRDYLETNDKYTTEKSIQHLSLARECLTQIKGYHRINLKIDKQLKKELQKEICKPGILLNKKAAKIITDSIAKYYRNEPDTLGWLKNIVIDGDKFVQLAAVQSIAEYYHYKNDDILIWLQDIASKHPDELVRRASVRSIADYYHTGKDLKLGLWDAKRSIGGYDDSRKYRTLPWLKDRFNVDQNKEVRKECVQVIAKYYHKDSDTSQWLKDRAMKDKNPCVQASAVEALACYCHNESDTFKWLQDLDLNLNDKHQEVRRVVIRSIAEYYPDPDSRLKWLKDRACNENKDIMEVAIESIAKYHENQNILNLTKNYILKDEYKSIPILTTALKSIPKWCHQKSDVLEWLEKYANTNQNKCVHSAAIYSISVHCLQCLSPDKLEWLKQNILNLSKDNQEQTNKEQKIAIQSIAKYYRDEPDTLTWLQECVEKVTHESVRIATVESIILYYHQNPNILEWLKALQTGNNNQKTVESIVVRSIAKYYRQELDTLRWLQERAEKATHESVRIAAVESIVLYYHQKPNILEWLKTLQTGNDNQKTVESIVVRSIAKYYRQELDTLRWLQERAEKAKHESVRIAAMESIKLYYGNKPEISEWRKNFKSSEKAEKKNQSRGKKGNNKNQQSESLQVYYVQAPDRDNQKQCGVESIDNYYHKEPDTLIRLQKIALEDKEANARLAAVESIVKYYPEEGDALKYLQEIAMEAHDLNVRLAAVKSIAQYYWNKSFIFDWLKECALNDHEPLVRSASIRAINEYFPKNNAVNNILQLVIDRDLDRNIDDEDYPKAVAVKILKDKYRLGSVVS